jgi:hypothetical protein
MRIFLYSLLFIGFVGCYSTERDCEKFQTGTFEFTSIIGKDTITSTFKRTKTLEIDTFKGITDSASVRWVSDCECIVQKLNPQSLFDKKSIQMKILSTNDNQYTFEYSLVGNTKNKQRGVAVKISD